MVDEELESGKHTDCVSYSDVVIVGKALEVAADLLETVVFG